MREYTIRDLETYREMWQVHRLQQKIWGLTDSTVGLYPPLLNTVAKNGGIVLGAFDSETDEMIAFIFSFLGREGDGPLKLCSQIMGVEQAWRGAGVAETLKQSQRQRALTQGLPLITWTYDPLEGPNAQLNLHKLRAISRKYLVDVYGSDHGALNAGLPTDRLLVEWWIQGGRLEREQIEPDLDLAVPIFETMGQRLERYILKANLGLTDELLLLETVADIHPLKGANMELAFDWRMKVRKAFQTYFAKGYLAIDFISTTERGQRRNRYLLQKGTPELLAEIGVET